MNGRRDILQVQQLSVDFATRRGLARVVDGMDLQVSHGEVLGIVGESGCGKSMTALAIMRLIPSPPGRISQGRILLEGRDLLGMSEKGIQGIRGNEISMIFQEPMTSLNPVFTVGTQVSESIRRHQRTTRREALDRAVEMIRAVGIPSPEKRIGQYPHELSGGMRQRVMIAMALSCRPALLIADEPTTALDVTVQAQIFDLLVDLQRKMGTAIILITHDMGVIAQVSHRVLVMYAGRKVEEGPVRDVVASPGHPYTRALIQCVPHLKSDPGPERPDLTEIPGVVPDMSRQLIRGCAFAPRCTQEIQRCATELPPFAELGERHRVACWLAGMVP